MDILRHIITYILARLREPSTIRALVYLATGTGLLHLDQAQAGTMAEHLVTLFGVPVTPVDITGAGFSLAGLVGLLPDNLGASK